MSSKNKLISLISLCMCLTIMMVVGILAVKNMDMNIGGRINFSAIDIYASISGEISGASNALPVSTLNYSHDQEPTAEEKATWIQSLVFENSSIPKITWTITINNKSERILYATLTDTLADIENIKKTFKFDGADYSHNEKAIAAKTTKVFVVEISVIDTEINASGNYILNLYLRDENAEHNADPENKISDFTFNIINENQKTAEVSGVRKNGAWVPSGEIEIPEYVKISSASQVSVAEKSQATQDNVYKVTKIADFAFTDRQTILDAINVYVEGNEGDFDFDALQKAGAPITKIKLPDTITHIGIGAFAAVMTLQEINVPQSLQTIGEVAFGFTLSLKNMEFVTLPKFVPMVESWGDPFYGSGIETLTIHAGEINERFSDLFELKTLILGHGVTRINGIEESADWRAGYAFEDCQKLETVVLPEGLRYICNNAFSGCLALKNITIPSTVTEIGSEAFMKCTSLENITIPDNVTSLSDYVFAYCSSLKNVTLSNNLKSIGTGAFYSCTALTTITLSSSVTSLDGSAFTNTNLSSLYLKSTTPPTLSNATLPSTITKIYVPTASVNTYKTTSNWSSYSGKITGYNF